MFVCLRGLKSRMGREGKGNGPQATWDRWDTDWRTVTSKVEWKHPMDSHWIILNAGASVTDKEAPANHHLRPKGNRYSGHNVHYHAHGFARISSQLGERSSLLSPYSGLAACGSDVGPTER